MAMHSMPWMWEGHLRQSGKTYLLRIPISEHVRNARRNCSNLRLYRMVFGKAQNADLS